MKHVYKILRVALLAFGILVIHNSAKGADTLSFHLSMENWVMGPKMRCTSFYVEIFYANNSSSGHNLSESKTNITFESTSLPVRIRCRIDYIDTQGNNVSTEYYDNWGKDYMCMQVGTSPFVGRLYYTIKQPIITIKQNGFPINNSDLIDLNRKITIRIKRNGFMGKMPIQIGKDNNLSSTILFTMAQDEDSMDLDPIESISVFSALFGGENEFVNKNFYLGFLYYYDCRDVPFLISSSKVVRGKVTGLLKTTPQLTTNLCANTPIIIDQKYIKEDHELVIKQGSEAERTIPITQFPFTLKYADLNAKGYPSQNYEIWVRNIDEDSTRTQRILVTYLTPPPDTTNAIVNITKVSCGEKSDGKISIKLPHEPVDSVIRYTCLNGLKEPLKNDVSVGGVVTFSNLSSGTYYFTVERNKVNGCYNEMGPIVVGLADRLTIDTIENTRIQTCSYTKDAQLTIVYRNGVGDVDFSFGNDTVEYPVIDTLRPNTSYTFTAIDSAGCFSDPFTAITKSKAPLNISLNIHEINCYGQTATEVLNATGGNGGYHFTINGTQNIDPGPYNFSGSEHVPDYAITVTDSKECNATRNVSFAEPLQLKFDVLPYKLSEYGSFNLKCYNDLTGHIILNHTGGTEPIQFSLIGDETYTSESDTFKALNAGTYKAFMKDAHNCSSDTVKNMILTQPEGIEFANAVKSSETCRGTGDAGITLDILGTPGAYQWFKDDIALEEMTTKNLSGVDSGNFRLNVTYNSGVCNIFSPFYTILPKKALNYVFTTHESCNDGIGGGEIRIGGITGGTAPYTFFLNNTQVNTTGNLPIILDNLGANNFNLEIRDMYYQLGGTFAEKCKVSKTIIIEPKTLAYLKPDYAEPLCNGNSNGMISVIADGPDDPQVTAWYNFQNDSIGTGMQLSNIPAGAYHARITDNRKCSVYQHDFNLKEPAPLRFSAINLEKAACTNVMDGKIGLTTPTGGTIGYQFSKDGGETWQGNPTFASLAEGIYPISVKDAHSCRIDTNITVSAFKPALTLKLDSITCYDSDNGKLSAKASGSKTDGLGYTYHLLRPVGPSTSNQTGMFGNLSSGTYSVYAQDQQNCLTDTLTENLWEPPLLTADLKLIDSASCEKPTGKLEYLIAGGNGGNTLHWKHPLLGDVNELDVSALVTGIYELTVTDRKECIGHNTLLIPDRPAPVISSLQMIKQPWCDKPLGAARVNVISGSKPYSYQWDDPAETQSNVASNLKEGTYRVVVTDRYQCMDEEFITIHDGPEIAVANTVKNPHCGHADGRIELQVTGGVDPYQFQWPDSISENPLVIPYVDNLYSGKYDISITDSVGCYKTFTVTLDDLSGPKVTSISSTQSWCGLSHGTAKVLATGGTLPYSYIWTADKSNQAIGSNPVISNLKAGDYKISIIDQEACKTFATVLITDSIELQPSLSIALNDSASCSKPTGRLKVRMNGGLPPYAYLWETGAKTDSLVNITAGKYDIKATDTRGCKDSLEITLIDRKKPAVSFISKESAYCGLPTGSAMVSASLGTAPYQVFLATIPAKKTPFIYDAVTKRYTGKIDSLLPLATPYRLLISDAYGCESNEMGVLINNHDPLTISLIDIAPVSCYGLSDGQAEIWVENGFEPYTYEWSTNTTNSPINHALPAGPFQTKVTDARGCIKTFNSASNPITQPQQLTLSDAYITPPSCFEMCDASISVNASGGNGNYLYRWNSTNLVQNITGLCPGESLLEVTDARNCQIQRTFNIINPDPLSETDLKDTVKVCSGQQFLANPGPEWNNVSWTSHDGLSYSGSTLTIENQGTYYMSGYSSAGCLVQDTITLIMTNDLLDAQFLMMSQAYVGDTVVIVEVTWPVADAYSWEMPEEARLIYDNGWVKEITFDEAGFYFIELTATLAGCMSVVGKHIEIMDIADPEPEEEPTEERSLIKSFVIYPNPADIDLNMDVKLSEERDIRIELYSLSGGMLTRVLNDYGMDAYTLDVNIEDLLPGTYIIKLIAGKEVKSKMLIVQ